MPTAAGSAPTIAPRSNGRGRWRSGTFNDAGNAASLPGLEQRYDNESGEDENETNDDVASCRNVQLAFPVPGGNGRAGAVEPRQSGRSIDRAALDCGRR